MASIRFHIKNPKDKAGKLRNTERSIYCIFTVSRTQRFEIRTGEKILSKHWDSANQQVKPTYRGHFEINEALAGIKLKLLSLYRENKESFSKFKSIAQAKPSEKKTLFLAFEQFLESYRNEKDSKTLQKYLTLERQLTTFDHKYSIDLQTLDFKFYDRFRDFLFQIPNQFYRKYGLFRKGDYYELKEGQGETVGIFDDQVNAYLIQTKTFLAWAEKRGYQVNPSYKSWKILRRKHDPISLTLSELESLENCTLPKSEDIARDYLVLQCRTGQRISDIKRFNLKDFIDDKWKFAPKKGNRLSPKTVTVHFKGFCAPALDILQKYNWKLPVISEQKLNEHIKTACKLAGITSPVEYIRWAQNKKVVYKCPKYELISSHCGRKTFITLSLQAGMPVEYVMTLTGITEYKTIKHYKAKFEDSAIEKELEKITGKTLMKKAQ